MFDLIKKVMLTGVGLASMTRDKIEDVARELKEKGKLSEEEGRELANELLKKSEQAKGELEVKIEKTVHKVLDKMNLATKEDIAALKEQIKSLKT
ncbi:MAG: phasin family protein [Thermodesulfobacteriota bacterium]|nr:phasin family protein [Thermodesulfobacteriota bacterium]